MEPCCSLHAEQDFQKKAFRDAALCIGWFKMMSVVFYLSLYYLTKFYSHGVFLSILLLLLLIAIVPAVFQGVMLFVGALQEVSGAILIGLLACYSLATYDLLLGLTGAAYHVAIAYDIQDYILTLGFALLALTSLPAFCHDAYIINAYRQILNEEKSTADNGEMEEM